MEYPSAHKKRMRKQRHHTARSTQHQTQHMAAQGLARDVCELMAAKAEAAMEGSRFKLQFTMERGTGNERVLEVKLWRTAHGVRMDATALAPGLVMDCEDHDAVAAVLRRLVRAPDAIWLAPEDANNPLAPMEFWSMEAVKVDIALAIAVYKCLIH